MEENFNFEVNEMNELLQSPIREITKVETKILYHYTNSTALYNIIDKGQLWVSKSDYLNDRSEITYTQKLLSYVEEIAKKDFINDEKFHHVIDTKFVSTIQNTSYDLFILSLTDNPDSLMLWSGYANNDGYNIGFDVEKFMKNLKLNENDNPDAPVFLAGKVIYDVDSQVGILLEEIKWLYQAWKQSGNRLLNNVFLRRMITYSMFFKDPSFNQEQEYRFVFMYNVNQSRRVFNSKEWKDKIHFRVRNGSIIPYIPISPVSSISNLLPIKNFCIGPKNNIDTAASGLKMFLDAKGYYHYDISKSNIPVRF